MKEDRRLLSDDQQGDSMFDPTFFHSVTMAMQDDRLRSARLAYHTPQAPAPLPTNSIRGRLTLRRLRAGFRLLSQPS